MLMWRSLPQSTHRRPVKLPWLNLWRKRRCLLILAGIVIATVTMTTMVTVESTEEAALASSAFRHDYNGGNSQFHRVKSLKVVRETLAFEDYGDSNSYNTGEVGEKGDLIIQRDVPVFNYQKEQHLRSKKNTGDFQKVPFKKVENKNTQNSSSLLQKLRNSRKSSGNSRKSSDQEANKTSTSDKFIDQRLNSDEGGYSYHEYESQVLQEQHFVSLPHKTTPKDKAPSSPDKQPTLPDKADSNQPFLHNIDNKHSLKLPLTPSAKKPGNWHNSQQMVLKENEERKKAADQFVRNIARGDSGATLVPEVTQGDLLVEITAGDHRVKLSQPCRPSQGNCNTDNEVPNNLSNATNHSNRNQSADNEPYRLMEGLKVRGRAALDFVSPRAVGKSNNQPRPGPSLEKTLATNKLLGRIVHGENSKQQQLPHSQKNSLQKHQYSSHTDINVIKSNVESNRETSMRNAEINGDDNKIETQIPIQNEIGPQLAVEYPATQLQHPEPHQQEVNIRSKDGGMPIVVDKVFWSEDATNLVPPGLSEDDFKLFLTNVRQQEVGELKEASWRKCGRPKNQFAVLRNGQKMCVRYREENHDKMVQGELLSYYLSRFLGLDNIPPVVLAQVDNSSTQWQLVKHNFYKAGWHQNHLVAFIMWINNIDRLNAPGTKMPSVILKAYENNSTVSHNTDLSGISANQLSEIIQWSDLILFDYITGNYDRVASMQDGAEKDNNPNIMHEAIRNLRKNAQNGKLWLIDNESGLLDAYELIYSYKQPSLFYRFHSKMLQTTCIFKRQTVEAIKKLAQFPNAAEILVKYAEVQDPLYKKLKPDMKAYSFFQRKFHTRLKEIVNWFHHCTSF